MFRAHFPGDFSMKFGVIFGHKVLTKLKRKSICFSNRFLKDFGAILAPEMVPGRGPKFTRSTPEAFKSAIHGLKVSQAYKIYQNLDFAKNLGVENMTFLPNLTLKIDGKSVKNR